MVALSLMINQYQAHLAVLVLDLRTKMMRCLDLLTWKSRVETID